jgi:hypothetical protein
MMLASVGRPAPARLGRSARHPLTLPARTYRAMGRRQYWIETPSYAYGRTARRDKPMILRANRW